MQTVAKLPMILKPLFQEAKTFWWPFRFLTYAVLAVLFVGLFFVSCLIVQFLTRKNDDPGTNYGPYPFGTPLMPYGDDDCDGH